MSPAKERRVALRDTTVPAWGKCDRDRSEYHHLAHHSMDVAAVFMALLNLPVIEERAERASNHRLTSAAKARLGALVFLHDIGKLHPGFQAKGWSKELGRHAKRGHILESVSFLEHACRYREHPFAESAQVLSTWGRGVEPLLHASFSHHGRPLTAGPRMGLDDWDQPRIAHYSWRSEAADMAEALQQWFPDAFRGNEAVPETNRFAHFFAGLAALADWIGSYRKYFGFRDALDVGYDRVAHDRAARVLKAIGLDVEHLRRESLPTFIDVSGFRDPNPAQAEVGLTSLDERIVILEAETGSGKTEAALWRFAQLFADRRVDGLYFAVPTRAAARQLHGRVDKAMNRLFGSGAPPAVLAIPGLLKAGEATGKRLPDWKFLWDDAKGDVPARWAAEHATRFLAATVAVGTVDQAMLGGLMVKHAHLRGSAVSRSLLVVDEVHASDAYMTRIIAGLLDSHLAVGGYAMLMSATLGSQARVRWTGESAPPFDQAVSTDYPAVWSGGNRLPRAAGNRAESKNVTVTLDGMEPSRAARLALSAADSGARVLLIRNTVTQAIETWNEVRQKGGENRLLQVANGPALHHGRFAAEDRELLDDAVEQTLSTERDRVPGGTILIGTQTLEQSLDIDADLLITDLCPVDVLLQRIGRLHRHPLPRPANFEDARCVVLTPEQGLDRLTQPAFENGLGAWLEDGVLQGIYRNVAVLELTRQLVERRPYWSIPEMNRDLVESATHPERVARLIENKGESWKLYDQKFGGVEAANKAFAELQRLDRDIPYGQERFPSNDERIMTRLGEEGIVLPLDPPRIGPFGKQVTRLALPARWSRGVSDEDLDKIAFRPSTEGFDFTLGDRSYAYRRTGLDRCS